MGTQLAVHDDSLVKTLQGSLYPGAAKSSVVMVLQYCAAAKLDPMLKPVHIVPIYYEDKEAGVKARRDVVMPGIGLYRIQASRTGQYGGQDDPEFGPEVKMKIGDFEFAHPEWCKVVVYRFVQGVRCPFPAVVFWAEEYATKGNDTRMPNAMWSKRPRGQISKCAEAAALRKAFPEVGSSPTAEEMEGKSWEAEDSPTAKAFIKTPVAREDSTKAATNSDQEVVDAETVEILSEPIRPNNPATPPPTTRSCNTGGCNHGHISWVQKKFKSLDVTPEAQSAMLARFGIESVETMNLEQFDSLRSELLKL